MITLSLLTAFSLASQTTVPIPDRIKEPNGGLTVTGEAGATQLNEKVVIGRLEVDAKGRIGKVVRPASTGAALGEEVKLPAGKYSVQYSGSLNVVDLKAGEHKTLRLSKLQVPRVDGSYTVKVFWDLTNPDQADRLSLLTWIVKVKDLDFHYRTFDCWGHETRAWTESESLSDLCRAATELAPLTQKMCLAYLGTDYSKLNGTLETVNANGSYSVINPTWTRTAGGGTVYANAEKFVNEGRLFSATGKDGDFFALLPGVYGLEMSNLAGKSSDQYGIELQ